MAEEETDSEDNGLSQCVGKSHPGGAAENRNGCMQNETGTSNQQEIQTSSAHHISNRQSVCPINQSRKISEEIDLSLKNNGELLKCYRFMNQR